MVSTARVAAAETRRQPGRPPKRRDQRERILREAARIIASVGYEECSLSRIAQALDLSAPALYHYFPTKQAIFTEIAMTAVSGIDAYVRDAIDVDADYGEQLRVMMHAHAEYFDQHYWMMNATIAGYGGIARRDIEQLDEFEAHRVRYEKLLLGILRGGMRSGEFRELNPKAVARSIFQLLNITRWYRPDGSRRAVDFAAENYELIYRSLTAPDT